MKPSQWKSHAVHGSLENLLGHCREADAIAREAEDPEHTATLDVLRDIVTFAQGRIAGVDPHLTSEATLNSINTQAQRSSGELTNYLGNKQLPHLLNAWTQMENALPTLGQLVSISAPAELEALGEMLQQYRLSVRGQLGAFTRKLNERKRKLEANKKQLADLESEVAAQKGRVDQVIADHQSQFSSAQESRAAAANEALTSFHEKSTQSLLEQAETLQAQLVEGRDLLASQQRDLEDDFGTFKDAVADYDKQAREVLSALGVTSQTAALGDSARREMISARVWQVITLGGLFGLVYIAVQIILPSVSGDFAWGTFAGRAFAGLTAALVASYSGAQARRHHRREEYYRNLQLQLSALDPYLATLPEERRVELKAALASQFFFLPESAEQREEVSAERKRVLEDVLKSLSRK